MDPLSDWDRPLTQEELDAIEAALDSASSLLKRKAEPENTTPSKNYRRLPSWGTQLSPSPNQDPQFHATGSDLKSYPRNQDFSIVRHTHVNAKLKYPSIKFGGHIVYCTTFSEVEKASLELLKFIKTKEKDMDRIPLGLDIEWRPTFRRGEVPRKAAVMQICGDTSHCYVLHIIHTGIPPTLQTILEDPRYVKVGVCIAGDADKILNDYNVHIESLEDLSWLANQRLDGFVRRWSLASLTETLTCKQLEKPNKIRLGNWEVKVLSKDQLLYAATDAYVSWFLYQILKSFPDLPKNQNGEKADDLPQNNKLIKNE